jgi:hypothetical protein
VWCSLQSLEKQPAQSQEFRSRIAMRHKGISLLERARLLEKRGKLRRLWDHLRFAPAQDPEKFRREAQLLLQQSDVRSIYPLNEYLRSKSLTPASIDSQETDRTAAVEQLCERRVQFLQHLGVCIEAGSYDLASGKLLRYEPDFNVSDGASQDTTYGYFDVNDAPPWDTWICFTDRSLISWVPPSLIDLVRSGIEVNPVDCIGWVDNQQLTKLRAAHG